VDTRGGTAAPVAKVRELADRLRSPYVLAKIKNPLRYRKRTNRSGQILRSLQHQPHPRGDDREQIARARQTAEALFTAKPPVGAPSAMDTAPAAQAARKPRVLQIISPAVPKPATPIAAEPPAPSVPAAQVERIRTWVKYGMTVRQVAEHYGAEIDEIRRIIGNS
jgi:hypothetical protein